MSANRYEISEGELDVLAIKGPEGTRYIDGEEIEARAIRQQARDIEQLRADLAAAVAITAARDETIAELELRLRISRMSNNELRESAERAEARLAAIDGAYTVADVIAGLDGGKCVHERAFGLFVPDIGTELIARPAKD